jgi:hypothetical protein
MIKSRRIRWARRVALMGEMTKAYIILVGIPEVRRPPERPRRRLQDDRMYLREIV